MLRRLISLLWFAAVVTGCASVRPAPAPAVPWATWADMADAGRHTVQPCPNGEMVFVIIAEHDGHGYIAFLSETRAEVLRYDDLSPQGQVAAQWVGRTDAGPGAVVWGPKTETSVCDDLFPAEART